ncbi:MAG: hypothetical protein ACYC5K_08720, partial [Saccharofermentanales bacterium]
MLTDSIRPLIQADKKMQKTHKRLDRTKKYLSGGYFIRIRRMATLIIRQMNRIIKPPLIHFNQSKAADVMLFYCKYLQIATNLQIGLRAGRLPEQLLDDRFDRIDPLLVAKRHDR